MTKACTWCKIVKHLEEYYDNVGARDGKHNSCKECRKGYIAEQQKLNPDKTAANKKRYVVNNLKKVVEAKAKYRESNRAGIRTKDRIAYKKNPKAMLARVRKYQATKLQATPKWLSKQQLLEMKRIYENCPEEHHVDHIVPLKGKNVRGLHVPWNLQYLPATVNRKKSNKVLT